MAKNAAPRPKSGNGASDDAAAGPPPESLDQVRDILFGGQMRMVDTRLRGLEERIAQEHVALRNELDRKISELEEASLKEFAAQKERLAAERTKRADDLKALSAELKESLKNLERRHTKFEEATAQADAEVRDHLMKQSAAFAAELSRTAERLTSELGRAEASLRAEKVDTTTLASTLTDMATRLTGGGGDRAPAKGSGKG
jgi:DNA repair exonuclease SbcCD ATPase subunit